MQNEDVVVADFMVYGNKHDPGSEFSVAVLPPDTYGSLLPEADRIAFVEDIAGRASGIATSPPANMVHVAWTDAMAIAGHLFEPVADLYPPRYRTVGRADAGTWSTLKSRSVGR